MQTNEPQTYYEYTEELLDKSNKAEKNALNLLNKNGISLYTTKQDKLNYISNASLLKYNTFDNIMEKPTSFLLALLRRSATQQEQELREIIDLWFNKTEDSANEKKKNEQLIRKKINNFKIIKGSDEYIVDVPTITISNKEITTNILTVKKNDKLTELLFFEKQEDNSDYKNFRLINLSIKFSDNGKVSKIECFDKNRKLIHCFDIKDINNIVFYDKDKGYIKNNIENVKTILQYFLFITSNLNLNIDFNIFINNFVEEIQKSIDENIEDENIEGEIYEMCDSILSNLKLSKNQNFDKKITLLNGLNRDYKYSISENNGKTSFLDANGNVINTKLNGYVKSNSWLGCCCSCVPNDENNVDLYQQEISLIDNKEVGDQKEIDNFPNYD